MSGPISSSNPEPDRDGLLVGVSPDPAGRESVGFDAPRLGKGRTIERRTDYTEAFPAVLSWRCTVSTDGVEYYPDHEWPLG